MVARPACRVRLDPIKAEVPQSKFIDKDINSPNRIVIADIIVKQCRKQSALVPILPDNKAHRRPLQIAGESYHIRRFHTASGQADMTNQRCQRKWTIATTDGAAVMP